MKCQNFLKNPRPTIINWTNLFLVWPRNAVLATAVITSYLIYVFYFFEAFSQSKAEKQKLSIELDKLKKKHQNVLSELEEDKQVRGNFI